MSEEAVLTADSLPDARKIHRHSPEDLDRIIDAMPQTDWLARGGETAAASVMMGVAPKTKAMLLALARRTGLSPTRALDTAVVKLYMETRKSGLMIPSADERAEQLIAGADAHNANPHGA